MKRILRSDWLPERARWAGDFPRWFLKRKFSFWPYNKSLIDQPSSVKMAVHWPRFF